MAFSVNTNANAMAALRSLNTTQNSITNIQSQIQSGLKVGSATDDPSTFVISQGMRGDVSSLKMVQEGLNFGSATVGMALAAATQISNQLVDLEAKVTQAENDGLPTATLQSEADDMVAQISGIVATASFNGINLINGAGGGLEVPTGLGGASISLAQQDATAATLGLNGLDLEGLHAELQMTDNTAPAESETIVITNDTTNDTYTFELTGGDGNALTSVPDEAGGDYVYGVTVDFANDSTQEIMGKMATAMREEGFTVDIGEDGVISFSQGGQDITLAVNFTGVVGGDLTQDAAGTALADIANAKTALGNVMTTLGTFANRLESQGEFTQVLTDKLEEGLGILVDANLAEVSAKLQSEQTKEQLGIQSLSIANAASQSILGLFR